MDEDLDVLDHDQLVAEAKRLRAGIREHRDSTAHDLCWHHPNLWGLLPERTDPLPVVPDWPQFMRGCIRYRQSLDNELAAAPRSHEEHATADAPFLRPVGVLHSDLVDPATTPKQGGEGAPDAWLEIHAWAALGVRSIAAGDELLIITWLHRADRNTLEVHPRDDARNPLTGVFSTRSADRPNPLGLHPVVVREIAGNRLRIGPIETIDGTPVVDIKPVLPRAATR